MIKTTGGGFPFHIDEEDLHLLEKYPVLARDINGYILCKEHWEATAKPLHRLIMDCPPHLVVDHINLNKADNRRANLRICTRAENNRNKTVKKEIHTSQYKGVKWHVGDQKWHSQIQVNRKFVWLGSYTNEVAAAERYDDAAAHFFREFALLNFPERSTIPYVARTAHKQHSTHKGISFDKTKKTRPWSACIQLEGVRWQDRFATEQEALEALEKIRADLKAGLPLPKPPKRAAPKYSQHPGITKDLKKEKSPWKAKIKQKGVIVWQGNFATEAEAITALTLKQKELNTINTQ